MADKKAYQEWHDMEANARQIAADQTLPLWQKAHKIPGAYTGLDLSGLQSKHRHKVLNTLGQINVILKKFKLDSFDDYENIDEGNLREIIRLAKGLSPPG
ncbi:hypothetical protein [Ketobacter sp.]